MKQLPEAAREIVERARDAHDPSEAQLQSMLAKLHTQLGYTELPEPEVVTTAAVDQARGVLHAKLLKLVLSLAAVGGMAALIVPQLRTPEPARPSVAAVEVQGAVRAEAEPTTRKQVEGNAPGLTQADAARENDARATALGRGAPSTGGAANRSAALNGDGSAARVAAERGAARDGVGSSRATAERGAAHGADESTARAAAERGAGAARARSAAERGVNVRVGGGSSRGAVAARDDVSALARSAADGGGNTAVNSGAAPQEQAGVLTAGARGATELGAHAPDDVAPAEKVLLSDDVVPLQTARKRAQDKARTASDADELRLIDRAASLLRDGEPEDALELLQEHGRKFPASQLKLERRGLSVLARCGAGQVEQGRRERDEFLRDAGKAPIAARVRRACPETSP